MCVCKCECVCVGVCVCMCVCVVCLSVTWLSHGVNHISQSNPSCCAVHAILMVWHGCWIEGLPSLDCGQSLGFNGDVGATWLRVYGVGLMVPVL